MCDCIAEMNTILAENNGGLVTTLFANPERVCVEVYQLKTGRGTKKPPRVLATFCPMCGAHYPQPQEA